jgi:hypothetical protein
MGATISYTHTSKHLFTVPMDGEFNSTSKSSDLLEKKKYKNIRLASYFFLFCLFFFLLLFTFFYFF